MAGTLQHRASQVYLTEPTFKKLLAAMNRMERDSMRDHSVNSNQAIILGCCISSL